MTISDVLSRGVQVRWPEAIAVVRAVAEGVSESGGVPDLHQIDIASDGDVRVTGSSRGDVPVARLGDVLQGLLVDADPPVKLRLIVTEATSPTPVFGSVLEFNEALGYYERPDRRAVVRGLYERAAAASAPAAKPATGGEPAPQVSAFHDEPVRPRPKARARRAYVVGTAVAAAVIAAVVLRNPGNRSSTFQFTEVRAFAQRIASIAGQFALSSASAVSQRLGLGRLVMSGAGDAEAPPDVAAGQSPDAAPEGKSAPAASRPSVESQNTAVPARPAAPLRAYDLNPGPAAPPLAEPAVPDLASPAEVAEAPAMEPEAEEPVDDSIHSADSPDVIPPVGVRPQLPNELPDGIRREDLTAIEVVVLKDGTVESVRLLSTPQSVQDYAWLSAVKAWQFRAAIKNGRPVRYRKVIWIAPQ
jgi:hypothetical protein